MPAKYQRFLTRDIEPWIVNGKVAVRGQFPYQIGMFTDMKDFCGGAIISDVWILTASHCVYDVKLFTVFFGALRMDLPIEAGRTVLNTREAFAHENYSLKGLVNDVALVKMPTKIKNGEFTLPTVFSAIK